MNQLVLYVTMVGSAVSAVAAFTAPTGLSWHHPITVPTTTELSAISNRREAFHLLFGGSAAAAIVTSGIISMPETANAVNPALETFKGGKKTKGSFIPGKGLRQHHDDELVAVNPALETFKGGKRTKGAFIPGKGLRQHDSDENDHTLFAANPALETFKGRKRTPGSFVPGKGIRRRHSDDNNVYEDFLASKDLYNTFDTLIAANPALETFKGRKRTPGSFMPGKGYVVMMVTCSV